MCLKLYKAHVIEYTTGDPVSEETNSTDKKSNNPLTSRCAAIYKYLAKKLPLSAKIPPPAINMLDKDVYSHHDGLAILIHPSLARLPKNEQDVELSRIAGYYLQYHRNQCINYLLNADQLSRPEELQLRLFSEIALTYAPFVGMMKYYDEKSLLAVANDMYEGARKQPKHCVHSAGAWYGSAIFLRHGDTVLDRVLTMTSARNINALRVAHLEGYEQTLSELRKVRDRKSDGQ